MDRSILYREQATEAKTHSGYIPVATYVGDDDLLHSADVGDSREMVFPKRTLIYFLLGSDAIKQSKIICGGLLGK